MTGKPAIDTQPSFAKFRATLLGEAAWRRPPQFDFHVAIEHKQRWLGRPIETPADNVAFWAAAGYDYVQAPINTPVPELHEAMRAERERAGSASAGGQRKVIESLAHYRSRRWAWQDVAEGDVSILANAFQSAEQHADALPADMKLLLHIADIYTFAWEMIGFDDLCLASIEQPDFIEAVMGDLGAAVERIIQTAVDRLGDAIGAVLYSDDIAYTEGLMLSPDFFAAHLFPWIERIVGVAATIDAPLIYHSDGKLYDVFDDLAAIGVRGIQPLEPKSMDPLEIKRRWPETFCLIGNIDLDLMARGEPEQVEQHVRDKIDRLNSEGRYIVGVSNTVPDYVKFENYQRMIETVRAYPNESI